MLPDTHPCVFTCVSRCPSSNHRVFAILNKLITHGPLLLSERGSILFLLHGGRHFLYSIWVSLKCFPKVVSWSNISSDLQMVDGGASGSEGSDISGIDEYIPDHFDGETDGFRHKFTLVLPSEGPGLGQCLAVKLVWRVGRSTIWRLSPQLGDRFGSVPDENGS